MNCQGNGPIATKAKDLGKVVINAIGLPKLTFKSTVEVKPLFSPEDEDSSKSSPKGVDGVGGGTGSTIGVGGADDEGVTSTGVDGAGGGGETTSGAGGTDEGEATSLPV